MRARRFLAILLTVALAASLLTLPAQAITPSSNDAFNYLASYAQKNSSYDGSIGGYRLDININGSSFKYAVIWYPGKNALEIDAFHLSEGFDVTLTIEATIGTPYRATVTDPAHGTATAEIDPSGFDEDTAVTVGSGDFEGAGDEISSGILSALINIETYFLKPAGYSFYHLGFTKLYSPPGPPWRTTLPGEYWTELSLAEAESAALGIYNGSTQEDTVLVFYSFAYVICSEVVPQFRDWAQQNQIHVLAYSYDPTADAGTEGSVSRNMWLLFQGYSSVRWPGVVVYRADQKTHLSESAVYSLDSFVNLVQRGIEVPGPGTFADVPESAYYYDPVEWAVQNGVTNGVDERHFGPDESCTRAQVVTFLWRAVGCPEPTTTECPFVDVAEGAYYYKPVLWAVENGVTNGLDATHFGSDATCTRGQIVTFLWRAMNKPTPTKTDCPFTDVSETAWFYQPVLWAVENGVTNGVDATHFGPDATCTRGQVVTFLYRAVEK